MHRTAKNAGKMPNIFIFGKTGDIVRHESVEKRIGIRNENQESQICQNEAIFTHKMQKTERGGRLIGS